MLGGGLSLCCCREPTVGENSPWQIRDDVNTLVKEDLSLKGHAIGLALDLKACRSWPRPKILGIFPTVLCLGLHPVLGALR